MSDAEVAKVSSASRESIRLKRVEFGIPCYGNRGNAFPAKVDWSLWDSKLGTVSDPTIAREINVSAQTVRQRRIKLKIPAWSKR